jgi:GNAT superfamily N-acetyltransferase
MSGAARIEAEAEPGAGAESEAGVESGTGVESEAGLEFGVESGAGVESEASMPSEPSWRVRAAVEDDVPAVAAAVGELLLELGGTPPSASAMEAAARTLLEDHEAGALLVAQAGDAIVGVLGASWQTAIHIPGRYALIQDLWVHHSWRGRAIGGGLLARLFELVGELRIARVEVGLPREGYPHLEATEAFYLAHGFAPLGARMRWVLP